MKKTLQFSISFFLILFLLISCNMPSDPFKNPSNSIVKRFLKENVNTIPFGSEVKIGVSIFSYRKFTLSLLTLRADKPV